jgi:parallel beta-helix repeat protein
MVITCNVAFAGRTIYVDDDGQTDFNTVQMAIVDANDGDTVLVAPGIYTGEGNHDIDFNGKAIIVRSIDPNDPNIVASTIIDCGQQGRGFNFHNGEGTDSVVHGLTVTGGSAKDGSGIFIQGSSPTIKYCNITGNSWDGEHGSGGGIDIQDGSPVISHCMISDNSTDWNGGGIFSNDSSPIIIDCSITGNQAFNEGGGICCWDGKVLISNCVIKDNITRNRRAGGIACRRSNLSITNCIIANNIASNSGGGGLWLLGANTKINQCTITGNSSGYMGGGIYFELGNATLINCILENNSAPNGPGIGVNSWLGQIAERSPYPEPYPVAFLTISYSNVRGGQTGVYVFNEPGWFLLNWGPGNIDTDPLFADPNNGDYHLKSQAGRFDPNRQSWVIDDVTSPCIDAGDPNSRIGTEPFPNGGVINMGAYGGTTEASKSYFGGPVCQTIITGDINGDCKVDLTDFVLMANHWLEKSDI